MYNIESVATCLTCGANGLFVELDLKTFACSRLKYKSSKKSSLIRKKSHLLKILLYKVGHLHFFAFLRGIFMFMKTASLKQNLTCRKGKSGVVIHQYA